MTIGRVAIVYDSANRPDTTGVYCLRALDRQLAVDHFQPSDLEAIPPGAYDLYLNIDDGLRYAWRGDLRPSAWWAIDTHLDLPWYVDRGRDFDRVFTAQRDGADDLQAAGLPATWLPLACDPEIHRRHDVAKAWNLGFVGRLTGERSAHLEYVAAHVPDVMAGACLFEEMARLYSASRIVFNRSVRNDVNMRVFEALACGSLLVTNDLSANGQADLFQPGKHLAVYGSREELLDVVAFYLRHDAERERIAEAGRAEALARHTYGHRMRTLVRLMESSARGRARAVAPAGAVRDGGYFEWARPEIVEHVPPTARRILDIGCGTGRLGAGIKARQPAHVTGIELNAAAAASARTRLDEVRTADVEADGLRFPSGAFDCVICGDVLEHMRRPAEVLRRIRAWLAPDNGVLIASIPNAQYHPVVRSLLDGNWTYVSAGHLDDTHLHFFTRRDLEDLFEREGFEIAGFHRIGGDGFRDWEAGGRPKDLRLGRLSLTNLEAEDAADFFSYQYLVVARRAAGFAARCNAADVARDVDFVVKTILRPRALARLLESIAHHYPDAQVTIADDGGIREAGDPDSRAVCRFIDQHPAMHLLALDRDTGISEGRNHLVRATVRPYLLLLDDDFCMTGETRVERLLEQLRENPGLGVAGGLCIDVLDGRRYPRRSAGNLERVGDRLVHVVGGWRDEAERLCDLVSHFALFRRDVFRSVRWRGGPGAEHYDLFLQLRRDGWDVRLDETVRIDHHPDTPALPGYGERRAAWPEAQQWLLREWGLRELLRAESVCTRSGEPA